ncbi:MAG: hypothetical protein WAO19_06245, partial [Candidatus Kryptoniota bacterium]
MKRLCILLLSLLITSCSTYYMTSASLKEQLEKIDGDKIYDAYDFRLGTIGAILKGGKNFYNGIDTLVCTDKSGKRVVVHITSQTGITLTDMSGRTLTLYFDSVFLRDSLIYGSKSHFITLPVTPMNIDSVV